MKLALIIFFFFTDAASSQIIVHDKNDKRLIAYQDSLKKYNDNEINKRIDIKILSSAIDLSQFLNFEKGLGYGVTNNKTTKDGKLMYDNHSVNIEQELLKYFTFTSGHVECIYHKIVKKPVITVTYVEIVKIVKTKPKPVYVIADIQPTRIKQTIYVTVDPHGKRIITGQKFENAPTLKDSCLKK